MYPRPGCVLLGGVNVYQRSAIVAAVLFLGLAAWAAFVPAHSGGDSCGTWPSPELTDQAINAQVAQARDVVARSAAIGVNTDQLQAVTVALVAEKRACDSSLSTRQALTWVGLAGALLVPGGILFVAQGRRRESDTASVVQT